jgi:hypothetical protein
VYDCTTQRSSTARRFDGLDNLDDRTEGFSDFEQRLDWTFRMAGYADKRHIAEWPTQAK